MGNDFVFGEREFEVPDPFFGNDAGDVDGGKVGVRNPSILGYFEVGGNVLD